MFVGIVPEQSMNADRRHVSDMASEFKTRTRNMTQGNIAGQLILFALPLMLGNVFQMLYNTVDSIVVGNYVGTQALAAVGSTTMIINMLVFFFNGFSTGAGVVIGNSFGAKDEEKLHRAVETTMAATLIFCVIFTVIGVLAVRPMLMLMATPEDVFDDASLYLKIYFMGITGLLIYNMGSGILRAVGDTTRPLLFLILTSVMNIILDLVFVLAFHMGIEGVAYATILSQMISALLTLRLLTFTREIYRLNWKDLQLDRDILKNIFAIGLPAGIQSVITSVSNVFVQSYINYFGSGCMAGWSCYNKLDQFAMLPIQSMAMASTTFVSQNIGARQEKRANRGTVAAMGIASGVTLAVVTSLYIFAEPSVRLFSKEREVLDFGILFIHCNIFFFLFNCLNHVLAGALRGRGDSRGPMVVMLIAFVGVRQLYLFVLTRYISNTPALVGFGYPVGWMTCTVLEIVYFFFRWTDAGKKIRGRLSCGES